MSPLMCQTLEVSKPPFFNCITMQHNLKKSTSLKRRKISNVYSQDCKLVLHNIHFFCHDYPAIHNNIQIIKKSMNTTHKMAQKNT